MTYPAALRSRRRRRGGIGSLCMDTDQGQYIGIDDNRLAHMREVGRLCYELAADLFGWDEQRCRQMFIMGFLHDVGNPRIYPWGGSRGIASVTNFLKIC